MEETAYVGVSWEIIMQCTKMKRNPCLERNWKKMYLQNIGTERNFYEPCLEI